MPVIINYGVFGNKHKRTGWKDTQLTVNDSDAAEQSYDTTNLHCCNVAWTVLLLRPLLKTYKFTTRTNQDALKWIPISRTPPAKLACLCLSLLVRELRVLNKGCIKNQAAGALARLKTGGMNTTALDEDLLELMISSVQNGEAKMNDHHNGNSTYYLFVNSAMTCTNGKQRAIGGCCLYSPPTRHKAAEQSTTLEGILETQAKDVWLPSHRPECSTACFVIYIPSWRCHDMPNTSRRSTAAAASSCISLWHTISLRILT